MEVRFCPGRKVQAARRFAPAIVESHAGRPAGPGLAPIEDSMSLEALGTGCA
jgi:hypothetical protein